MKNLSETFSEKTNKHVEVFAGNCINIATLRNWTKKKKTNNEGLSDVLQN